MICAGVLEKNILANFRNQLLANTCHGPNLYVPEPSYLCRSIGKNILANIQNQLLAWRKHLPWSHGLNIDAHKCICMCRNQIICAGVLIKNILANFRNQLITLAMDPIYTAMSVFVCAGTKLFVPE